MNSLLTKGARVEFKAEHMQIPQILLEQLWNLKALAFTNFPSSISRDWPFQYITDASVEGGRPGLERLRHPPDLFRDPSNACQGNKLERYRTRLCRHRMGRDKPPKTA